MTSPLARLAACVFAITLATSAVAKPHNVLVLPIDGNADPATRSALTATLQKLARLIDGQVTGGTTTFAETSSAVGCDPAQPKCVDEVLAAVSVDEIVWGTATTQRGQTTVVVHRATKGAPPRDLTATIASQDGDDKTEAALLPLFHTERKPVDASGSGSAVVPLGSGSDGGSDVAVHDEPPTETPPDQPMTRDRKLGLELAIGGGVGLIVGVALWSSEASLQGQINSHPTETASDIADLKSLEDRANRYAWAGNVMVVVGLAVGGAGAYYLWKDHRAQATVTASPVAPNQGAGGTVSIRGVW